MYGNELLERRMEEIRDRTFEGETVYLDDRYFTNCHLIDCDLRYSGGEFTLQDTSMLACRWGFGGAAQRTLTLVRTMQLGETGEEFNDRTAVVWTIPPSIH